MDFLGLKIDIFQLSPTLPSFHASFPLEKAVFFFLIGIYYWGLICVISCGFFSHNRGNKKFFLSFVVCVVLEIKHHKEDESDSRSFSSRFSNSFVILSISTVCANLKTDNKRRKKKQRFFCEMRMTSARFTVKGNDWRLCFLEGENQT